MVMPLECEKANAMNVLAAMLGFLVLGLSPSFVDWEQSPEKHAQIVVYYSVALGLLYLGLFAPSRP